MTINGEPTKVLLSYLQKHDDLAAYYRERYCECGGELCDFVDFRILGFGRSFGSLHCFMFGVFKLRQLDDLSAMKKI